ncbi:MAG TPA: Re/Si-specific NAD(P)(+) transhydrogenase subunit alpha [Polyangiaceae bacterium]|jgi:NAD(P) transhydrogenase subunit alpha
MRLAVPRDDSAVEKRVPIVPESVRRLVAKKIEVCVESGAGGRARIGDDEYGAAGATVEPTRAALLAGADAVVRLRVPTVREIEEMKEGATLVSPLYPLLQPELVRALAARKMTSIALDLVPRTTVAQMMDVLSSQATVAGYCAVLMAANELPRFFPMLMTAAGTIAPARVLVLGAGVAGLTAIGTARRLGAVVEAFDVRKAVKEQVESLGAKFVEVDAAEDAQTAGGYAKETSEEYKRKQADALARHVKGADVVITTALIPGRRAPLLVTEDMVRSMKAGSVIVDLAAEQQGNCALTEAGKVVERHGVTIVGVLDLPGRLAVHASQMFSRNVEKLLLHVVRQGAWRLDPADEIVAGALVTMGGDVVHPRVKERMA